MRQMLALLFAFAFCATGALADEPALSAQAKQANDLIAAGKNADAVTLLTPYINSNPADGPARLARGKAYQNMGKFQESMTDLDAAVVLMDKSWDALNTRCYSNYQLGKFDAAIADCTASIAIAPTGDALRFRIFAEMDSNKFDTALADATTYVSTYPNLSRPVAIKCAVEFRMKNYDAAKTDCATALTLPGVEYYGHKYSGLLAAQSKDWATMEAQFSAILADDPSDSYSLYQRATARYAQNKLGPALTDIDQYLSAVTNDGDGFFLRAQIEQQQGNKAKARSDAQIALGLYKQAGDAADAASAQQLLSSIH